VKHLVDLDDELLAMAKVSLGTETIKDTVNDALRLATRQKRDELNDAMDRLAELATKLPIEDRSRAW
jgi:Arc/MetJ family transcription regulator